MSRGTIIVAMTIDGVIGLDNKIPWKHKGDQARFKELTMGGAIIMGRRTWESIGEKPLPGRKNLVISSQESVRGTGPHTGAECFKDLPEAMLSIPMGQAVWFIGGARIYEEALKVAERIDITFVPDRIANPEAVVFPKINIGAWLPEGPMLEHAFNPLLGNIIYKRHGG